MPADQDFDIWRDVYYARGQQIEHVVSRRDQQTVLIAIVGGATSAARGVASAYTEMFPELRSPEFDSANAVTGVFAMAMVSRSMRSAWHGRDQDAHWDTQWGAITRATLTLFGTYSVDRYQDARALDVQFRHVRDQEDQGVGSGLGWWTELEILLTLALAAVRGTNPPRLSSVPVPVAGSYELSKAGWPSLPRAWYDDLEHATEAHASLLAAEAGMATSLRTGMKFVERER